MIDKWANFLANEKLTPKRVDNPMVLVELCEALAAKQGPKTRPYAAKQESRLLVCETAIDLGIDLTQFKIGHKLVMARSLLDAWNKVYEKRFGSTFGTVGEKEVTRRLIKTQLRSTK